MKHFATAVACLAAGLFFVSTPASGAEDWKPRVAKAQVSAQDAMKAGLEAAGGGAIWHVELEEDRNGLIWSVDVAHKAGSINLHLDAVSGQVLFQTREPEDYSAAVAACKIDMATAISKAQSIKPGAVIEGGLVMYKGEPMFRVNSWADNAVVKLVVDATTGKVVGGNIAKPEAAKRAFTDHFRVDKADLGPTGENPYFSLRPGHELVLEGTEGSNKTRVVITVLDRTKFIDGVECRVIRENETENGAVIEISHNYYAISKKTNDVYYFGEDVDMYENGKVTSHHGAWISGKDGAVFGLIMPGTPLIGATYYQEIAPGVAMDRARVDSLTAEIQTPAGTFSRCLKTVESTPLESGQDSKLYAYGVGLVKDAHNVLVSRVRAPK